MPTKLEISNYFTDILNHLNELGILLHDIESEIDTLQDSLKDYQRDYLGKHLTKTSQKT